MQVPTEANLNKAPCIILFTGCDGRDHELRCTRDSAHDEAIKLAEIGCHCILVMDELDDGEQQEET